MLIVQAALVLAFLAPITQADPVARVTQPLSTAPTYATRDYGKRHARGFVRGSASTDFFRYAPRDSFTNASTSIPGQYSMREKAGPVEDQGQCGSCWDFSLTSVLRGTWIMEGRDPGRLSFNYLLNCATDQQGCDGGDFTAAAWFVHPKGVPAYGSDGDYDESADKCVSKPAVADAASYHMLGTSGTKPSFKDIAYVLSVLHRPVSVDLAADDNWENYAYGVFNYCSDQNVEDINHMVSIEGYNCETSVDASGNCVFDSNGNLPPGIGTWIVRNSWGDGWGDEGYIVTKATNGGREPCNEIANDALYFDVAGSGY